MSDPAIAQAAAGAGGGLSLKELAIVVLLGAAVGAGFETMHPSAVKADRPVESAAAPPSEPSTLYDLPPVITNLGSPQDVWIRFEGSIVFDPKTLSHPEAIAGEIGDDFLAYLRTVSLKQLEGPIGLQNIREDLKERAATRSGGKVRELVIRTLVVQ
ncbi:MAG: flagellar basal body-associated FliL family protein [Hyphomicrobiales bacterium]|nr:flagellar basal body-associated FliL family protein [Hyphomicrobiales bacterium]MBV8441361.1 flagellar basal body-associated FliL family protein [Hyphomicrobiales bacterium]